MAKPTLDPGMRDALEALLIRAEDMGYQHAVNQKLHYRSWATVDLLYQLIATLVATEPESDSPGGKGVVENG